MRTQRHYLENLIKVSCWIVCSKRQQCYRKQNSGPYLLCCRVPHPLPQPRPLHGEARVEACLPSTALCLVIHFSETTFCFKTLSDRNYSLSQNKAHGNLEYSMEQISTLDPEERKTLNREMMGTRSNYAKN